MLAAVLGPTPLKPVSSDEEAVLGLMAAKTELLNRNRVSRDRITVLMTAPIDQK